MRVTPTAVEFDDPGGNNVEEVSVMCDKNYCAWKPLEKLFEPADRFRVKMVGWFVEQEQVRLSHQRPAKRPPPFLAARKRTYQRIQRRRAQSGDAGVNP